MSHVKSARNLVVYFLFLLESINVDFNQHYLRPAVCNDTCFQWKVRQSLYRYNYYRFRNMLDNRSKIIPALIYLVLNICYGFRSLEFSPVLSDQEIFDRFDHLIRVDYQVAIKSMQFFHWDNVTDFRPLLISEYNNKSQVLIGARNHVFLLNPVDLTVSANFYWPSSQLDSEMCQKKGQKEPDCHNFIKLIQPKGDHFLICGTNAFAPLCIWVKVGDLNGQPSQAGESFDGRGYVPLNPKSDNTYVMSQDGQLFTGVTMDISAHEPAILRMLPEHQQIKTDRSNSRWLNEPVFVASFDVGNFIYVFFRELAMEATSCGKFIYSRVARVCKNDVGVDGIRKWSTCTKVRLNCTISNLEEKFAFDLLKAVHYSEDHQRFTAVFSAQNEENASAICIFDLSSLKRAFSGPYLYAESQRWPWISEPNRFPDFNCQTNGAMNPRPNLTKRPLSDVKRYQLMQEAAQPRHFAPIHVSRMERNCIESRDPYCGWNGIRSQCTSEPVVHKHAWIQNIDQCPEKNRPVDGQYGPWSSWNSCPFIGEKGENCLCRSRQCDKPAPKFNGKSCSGPPIQVANCTQHGSWANWGDWSTCSTTCGSSVRSRRRFCSNPPPSFGGRVCLGLDTQQEFCARPACPVAAPAPVHGHWSGWSVWSQCSKPCDGGYQKRFRTCSRPPPAHNGNPCFGNTIEYKDCNTLSCPEVTLWSDWTPWMQSNFTTQANIVELKRFRVACQSRKGDSNSLTILKPSTEEKMCHRNLKNCEQSLFRSIDGNWSEWSEWSICSASCNNGSQFRSRQCNNPTPIGNGMPCSGHSRELRVCNANPCQSFWSCWSDFSDCSTTCGTGYKHRQRTCNYVPGATPCDGDTIESVPCESGPCTQDGFAAWSGWSTCNRLGVQVRIRPCIFRSFCKGIPDAQIQQCHFNSDSVKALEAYRTTHQAPVRDQPRKLNWPLILSVIVAFVCGVVLTFILSCYAQNSRKKSFFQTFCFNGVAAWTKKPPSATVSSSRSSPSNSAGPRCSLGLIVAPAQSNFGGRVSQSAPLKSNIYTPPPTLRNHKVEKSALIVNKPDNSALTAVPKAKLLDVQDHFLPTGELCGRANLDGLNQIVHNGIQSHAVSSGHSNPSLPNEHYSMIIGDRFEQMSHTFGPSEHLTLDSNGYQQKFKSGTGFKRGRNKLIRNLQTRSYAQDNVDDRNEGSSTWNTLLGVPSRSLDPCSLSLKKNMMASLKTQDYL